MSAPGSLLLVSYFYPPTRDTGAQRPAAMAKWLARLGWEPEVALFADAFGGAGKSLAPVLDHLGLDAAQVVYVGDTDHDRRCAAAVGCRFVWAGWNPRARPVPGDEVLRRPGDLVGVLAP